MTLNETHVFGPGLVNEARFGFNRIDITFDPNAKLNPVDYGMNVGVTTPIGIPQVTVQGLGLNFGGPANFPQGRTDTTFVFSDSASYLRGKHTLKLGGEYRRFNNENFTSDTGTFQYGSLAAFQTGVGNLFAITLGDRPSDITQQAVGLFVQDQFHATSRLTFELGLRWDQNIAPTDSEDRFVVFDPATVSLVRVGTNGRDSVYNSSSDFQPRVGAIFDVTGDGRTIVRGAYAIMTDQPVTNAVTQTTSNPPLATPLNFQGPIRLQNAVITAQAAGLAPASVSPDFTSGRMQTWNVNVERELRPALGVMIGYFGSTGGRLRVSRNINQLVNGVRPFQTLSASSSILPGASLLNITEVTSLGSVKRSAVQRLLHVGEVQGHQLVEFAGAAWLRAAEQLRFAGQQGAIGFRRPPSLCHQRDLRTAVQGQPNRRRMAAVRDYPGADRQPGQHRHEPLEPDRCRQHPPP
ncbi:MAG: hypothetical protein DMF90_24840 [Acidobacteria bacterium]|nr:MAG: hypothetical protein DMF90_24840 [Acidobacteriota bacterium]